MKVYENSEIIQIEAEKADFADGSLARQFMAKYGILYFDNNGYVYEFPAEKKVFVKGRTHITMDKEKMTEAQRVEARSLHYANYTGDGTFANRKAKEAQDILRRNGYTL